MTDTTTMRDVTLPRVARDTLDDLRSDLGIGRPLEPGRAALYHMMLGEVVRRWDENEATEITVTVEAA